MPTSSQILAERTDKEFELSNFFNEAYLFFKKSSSEPLDVQEAKRLRNEMERLNLVDQRLGESIN